MEEHICKYCNALVTAPDEECYKAPPRPKKTLREIYEDYCALVEKGTLHRTDYSNHMHEDMRQRLNKLKEEEQKSPDD